MLAAAELMKQVNFRGLHYMRNGTYNHLKEFVIQGVFDRETPPGIHNQ